MLDPRLLRADLGTVASRLARRGYVLDTVAIAALEEKRKSVQVLTQQFQNERNASSKAIGQAKARGEDTSGPMADAARMGARLKQAESELEAIQAELNALSLGIPNIPHTSVPDGRDERDNVEDIAGRLLVTLRDADILGPMGAENLARASVSVTTLDRRLARTMEPRAATPAPEAPRPRYAAPPRAAWHPAPGRLAAARCAASAFHGRR